jgi:hypothetical protein
VSDYLKDVKMWNDGKTIGDIANTLGLDALKEFIRRMGGAQRRS